MSHGEFITQIVEWLAVTVLTINAILVVFIFWRRLSRNRYYAARDLAYQRYSDVVTDILAGHLSIAAATEKLKLAVARPERDAIQAQLLRDMAGSNREQITRVLMELKYVQHWAQQAFGKRRSHQLLDRIANPSLRSIQAPSRNPRFASIRRLRIFAVRRALAAHHLGQLAGEFLQVFTLEALRDPSPLVARIAISALGRNRVSGGVPVLLQELRKAVAGETEIPVRGITTAIVRYPPTELHHMRPFLADPADRFRFLVVDCIRQICLRAQVAGVLVELPDTLRQWFLNEALQDASADVRARSAQVIGVMHDPQSATALRALLRDKNEFVRLHAVRASADYTELTREVLQCVHDPRWRVREAAVRALRVFGANGPRQLETLFLSTGDRYASEQLADEMQRTLMVPQTVAALALPYAEAQGAEATCRKLLSLGMDSVLLDEFQASAPLPIRQRLLELLSASQSERVLYALRHTAADNLDPLKGQAELLLQKRAALALPTAAEAH